MIIKTKLLFKKYLHLMFIITYRKPIMIFISTIGLIMFLGSIFYFSGFNVPFDNPPFIQLLVGSFLVFLIPFFIYRSAKKNFSSNKRLQENLLYEITNDKIIITGESYSSELNLEKAYRILELRNWILIYQDKLIVYLIPKDCFGSNLKQFKELIKKKIAIKNNFSAIKKIFGIITMTLPLLFFLLIGLFFVISKAEPEIFLIPKNYQGEIIVVFDQKNGTPTKLINKKRLYEIPDNGILVTQFKWNAGSNNREFFYNSNDVKIEIDEVELNYKFENGKNDGDIISVIDKRPFYYSDADEKKYLFRADRFIISKRKMFSQYSVEKKTDSIIENVFNRDTK